MKKLLATLALSLTLTPLTSFAAAPSTISSNEVSKTNPIVEKFSQLGLVVKDIKPSPILGLKELITDKGVMYASDSGQYLLQGTLIDIENRENLTEKALNIYLEQIDNERAFKLVKQDEEVEKSNNKFWSKIKLINN